MTYKVEYKFSFVRKSALTGTSGNMMALIKKKQINKDDFSKVMFYIKNGTTQ
jgi:hypothetical protein